MPYRTPDNPYSNRFEIKAFDPDKKAQFDKICRENDTYMSVVVRKLIDMYIQGHIMDDDFKLLK
jgi:Ribbon-helix-helix protein